MDLEAPAPGLLIDGRYRLVDQLSDGPRGQLWRAEDQQVAGAEMALRRLEPGPLQPHWRELLESLEGLSHPQLPPFSAALERGDELWLVRPWLPGRGLEALLEERRAARQPFSSSEVILLLRQLLPLLEALHGRQLLLGDLGPANLLLRAGDGLPLPLDFACSRRLGSPAEPAVPELCAATAPPELLRGDPPEPWMDLHALGLLALVLLSGEAPEALRDSHGSEASWPCALAGDPALRQLLQRLLGSDPELRFASAGEVLEALETFSAPAPASRRSASRQQRDDGQEGALWPVVCALLAAAVLGSALGWWWLGRSRPLLEKEVSLPPPEASTAVAVDRRQELQSRLRALEIDQGWFLRLLEASRQAGTSLATAGASPGRFAAGSPNPDRSAQADQWLARLEPLPLVLRRRLGRFSYGDWQAQRRRLAARGLSDPVLDALVAAAARPLLPLGSGPAMPPEPFRQLWYAAAELTAADLRLEPVELLPLRPRALSAEVAAGAARPFVIRFPPGHRLVLAGNGSALLEMAVHGADGAVLAARGPLRLVSLGPIGRSPVQVLVFNDGLAPAPVTLSLRADPPRLRPPLPPPPAAPEAPGASG